MIEARLSVDGIDLGKVQITSVQQHDDGTADYSVTFEVDRIGAVGVHQRPIYFFPRLRYNVLGLFMQALTTLTPKELELEPDVDPSDLARRQRAIGSSLPPEAEDPLGHH